MGHEIVIQDNIYLKITIHFIIDYKQFRSESSLSYLLIHYLKGEKKRQKKN